MKKKSRILYYVFTVLLDKNYFIFSVSEPETEEDLLKKDAKNKMKEEYYFAIQEEGNLLISIKSLHVNLIQLSGHLSNTVSGHLKFMPSYQFTGI